MRLKSVVNAAAYGISASVLSFAMAANANAQHVSTGCQPKAQVEAAIASGGFKPIALGNRVDGVGNANIYFANKDGYGFSAEGDQPVGKPANKKICVTGRYKEVRVNDPRNDQIPSWLKIKDGDGNDYTNFSAGYAKGSRIVFTALGYDVKPDGTESLGKTLALYASPDKTATVEAIDYRGYSQAFVVLKDFALTSNANDYVAAAPAPSTDVILAQASKMTLKP